MASKQYPWSDVHKGYAEGKSIRTLAEEYNVPRATLERKAKRENWNKDRDAHTERYMKIKIETDMSLAEKCSQIETMMVDKVMQSIKTLDYEDRTGMKQVSSVIRDLKEVKIWVNELDKAEQLARIKKLEHDASDIKSDTTINITIDGADGLSD